MTFEELLKLNDGPAKEKFTEIDIECFVTLKDLSVAIINKDFVEGERIIRCFRGSNEGMYSENKELIMNTFNYFDVEGMQYKDFLGLAVVSVLHSNYLLFCLIMVAVTYKLGIKQNVSQNEYQSLQTVNSMCTKFINENISVDIEISNIKVNTSENVNNYLTQLKQLFRNIASEILVRDSRLNLIVPKGFIRENFITFMEDDKTIKMDLLAEFEDEETVKKIYGLLHYMELEAGVLIFNNYQKTMYETDDMTYIIKFSREFAKEDFSVHTIYKEIKELIDLPNKCLESIESSTTKNNSNYRSSSKICNSSLSSSKLYNSRLSRPKIDKGCLLGVLLSLLYPIIVILIAIIIGST